MWETKELIKCVLLLHILNLQLVSVTFVFNVGTIKNYKIIRSNIINIIATVCLTVKYLITLQPQNQFS